MNNNPKNNHLSQIEEIQLKHQQQIELIEKKHHDTIISLILNYEDQLKERRLFYENRLGDADGITQESVKKLEKKLKSSLTWRIGWSFTSTAVLCFNFFRNPLQFFTNKKYRWQNLYYFPSQEKDQKPSQKQNRLSNDQIVKRDIDIVAEINPGKQTLMCVFDTFTKTCFAPEFNVVCPTPDNWKQGFEKYSINAVFIESAWHGNDNSWEALTVNSGGLDKLETMKNLITAARSKGIPTIFWNKEDPVHFNGFIDTAKMMDYVFTSDAESVPKYLGKVSHRNVYALPFAAQHKVHNPVRLSPRNKNVSFAGTYYNFSFAERKLDLDILLKPAMAFGLDIYDRNFGSTGLADEEYKFPAIYKPAIKGKLAYQDMLEAYKTYKVFLNVNSVKYSSTMFARRVFELLACGTPVISNYSKGIVNLLGEDTVFISESEGDTRKYLEKLVGDDHYWWKTSLHGMRKVMEHHTYEHRTAEIFSIAGIGFKKPDPVSFAVVAVVSSQEDANYLAGLLMKQHHKPAGVVFVAGTDFTGVDLGVDWFDREHPEIRIAFVSHLDNKAILDKLALFPWTHVAFLNPRDFYGENYLRDYSLAATYSDAKVFGKQDQIAWHDGTLKIPGLNADYRCVEKVPTSTLIMEKATVMAKDICGLFKSSDFAASDLDIFSIDPFNYVPDGREPFLKDEARMKASIGI